MATQDDPIRATADGLGKVAAEAYGDIARPAARQVGGALETLFKIGLSPVAMLDWGFEQSKDWLSAKISQRLRRIPPDCQTSPPSNIAVPAILQIAASADAPELRELYAELLLKAMDARSASRVHPSYVSLVAQLSPQEALVFLSFKATSESNLFSDKVRLSSYSSPPTIEEQFEAYCSDLGFGDPNLAEVWLDNLQRLGIVSLERYSDVSYVGPNFDRPPSVDTTEYRHLHLTAFGRTFLEVCAPEDSIYEPTF
jgi:hypothetical protein